VGRHENSKELREDKIGRDSPFSLQKFISELSFLSIYVGIDAMIRFFFLSVFIYFSLCAKVFLSFLVKLGLRQTFFGFFQ
jgi:hypothetical protein